MANRKLILRECTNGFERYWDYDIREQFSIQTSTSSCNPFHLDENTLIDSWCEGSTQVRILAAWDGYGRPPQVAYKKEEIANAESCSVTTCGLKIDDVSTTKAGDTYTVTVFTSGYSGAIEYSLNGFTDVQDSNVFTGLSNGSYIAYARAKR